MYIRLFYDVYRSSVEALFGFPALFSLCVSIWIISSVLCTSLLIFSSTVLLVSLEMSIK